MTPGPSDRWPCTRYQVSNTKLTPQEFDEITSLCSWAKHLNLRDEKSSTLPSTPWKINCWKREYIIIVSNDATETEGIIERSKFHLLKLHLIFCGRGTKPSLQLLRRNTCGLPHAQQNLLFKKGTGSPTRDAHPMKKVSEIFVTVSQAMEKVHFNPSWKHFTTKQAGSSSRIFLTKNRQGANVSLWNYIFSLPLSTTWTTQISTMVPTRKVGTDYFEALCAHSCPTRLYTLDKCVEILVGRVSPCTT